MLLLPLEQLESCFVCLMETKRTHPIIIASLNQYLMKQISQKHRVQCKLDVWEWSGDDCSCGTSSAALEKEGSGPLLSQTHLDRFPLLDSMCAFYIQATQIAVVTSHYSVLRVSTRFLQATSGLER